MSFEEFIGDTADRMTFNDSIYALYASLRSLKELKQKETPEGQFSFVAGNCHCMLAKLCSQYPEQTIEAEIEYELNRVQ